MFQGMNRKSSAFDLAKGTLWNVVLYFVYFFTLLFWLRLIGVDAQGNRGVVINNKKFDDSSGVHYAHQTNHSSQSTTQVIIYCKNNRK